MTRSQRWYFVRCLAGFLLLGILTSPPVTAGEPLKIQSPRQIDRLLAQAEPVPPGSAESPRPQQLPPGGTSVEDLLLQKGTITMDEWIQIRAEQEYKGAENSRRIDGIEDWKTRTELLPILRDKVNFGLNALQFLYTHQDARSRKEKVRTISLFVGRRFCFGDASATRFPLARTHGIPEHQLSGERHRPEEAERRLANRSRPPSFGNRISIFALSILGALFELYPHGYFPYALRHLHRNPAVFAMLSVRPISPRSAAGPGTLWDRRHHRFSAGTRFFRRCPRAFVQSARVCRWHHEQQQFSCECDGIQCSEELLYTCPPVWYGCLMDQFYDDPGRIEQCQHQHQRTRKRKVRPVWIRFSLYVQIHSWTDGAGRMVAGS